ncbi:MAG: T9SS type A sorting domain-containing protein [Mariniphaga sp.]|nr:T9SS type A sorting domain-containing protein [Mariniphaga sp.]
MKHIFTLLITISLTVLGAKAQNVGSVVPDFTLQDTDGENFTLSNNKGKVIFIFLLGYNCHLCINATPTVKSTIINQFNSNNNFLAIEIDAWNGSITQVKNFKTVTGLDIPILQKGSDLVRSWSTFHDRLVVIDSQGIMRYKGTLPVSSTINSAKSVVEELLNNLTTDVFELEQQGGFLYQNFPNPVTGKTNIYFNLESSGQTQLKIYNVAGELINIPVNEYLQTGRHLVTIDGINLKSGVYLYNLESNGKTDTKRMLVK